MRKLWIFAEFSYRRRTGEGGGRIRLGKDRRLDVCGGGRVHLLVYGLVFNLNRLITECLGGVPSRSTECPEAREQSAPVESIKKTW